MKVSPPTMDVEMLVKLPENTSKREDTIKLTIVDHPVLASKTFRVEKIEWGRIPYFKIYKDGEYRITNENFKVSMKLPSTLKVDFLTQELPRVEVKEKNSEFKEKALELAKQLGVEIRPYNGVMFAPVEHEFKATGTGCADIWEGYRCVDWKKVYDVLSQGITIRDVFAKVRELLRRGRNDRKTS